jgi:hypothetical protein
MQNRCFLDSLLAALHLATRGGSRSIGRGEGDVPGVRLNGETIPSVLKKGASHALLDRLH